MRNILPFEINTGTCSVPVDGEFLSFVWRGSTLFAYYAFDGIDPVLTTKDFYLVNLNTQDSVPDGYTLLSAAGQGGMRSDNWVVFVR